MRQAILDAGKPPDGITGAGALGELRARAGYEGEPAHLAPMQLDLVSLPPVGSKSASLEMLFQEEAEIFKHRLLSKVLADEVVKQRKEVAELKKPYMDPLLRSSPRIYADFCRMLLDRGLIELRTECREVCGAFTVWKKNGRQRLVLDCRLSNLWFDAPRSVSLATGSSFGQLELGDHGGACNSCGGRGHRGRVLPH